MKLRIKLTLTEEMLGTKAANKDVFADFIASKHPSGTPQRDELDNAEHREEAGTTVFHRMKRKDIAPIVTIHPGATKVSAEDAKLVKPSEIDNPVLTGNPEEDVLGIYDYQIKGFFKDACAAMNRFDPECRNNLEKLSAYKSKIDGCIFVFPRFIEMKLPDDQQVGICERPLRAETAQGPRVSVCRSESVPAGTTMEFDISILSKELQAYVEAWLRYGALKGLGQWRNSGKGRFTAEIVK